jgi:hypothetical protein
MISAVLIADAVSLEVSFSQSFQPLEAEILKYPCLPSIGSPISALRFRGRA